MNARRDERGFTLLEVLVATAILGVAVVTLLGLHARNLSLAAEAETTTIAATLASDAMVATLLDPVLEMGARKGTFATSRRDADGERVLYGGARSDDFTWGSEVMPTALPTLLQVRVQVFRSGDERPAAELWSAVPAKRLAGGLR